MAEVFAEYAGLTADAVAMIEGLRRYPTETKSEILIRVLRPLQAKKLETEDADAEWVDFKEGIKLKVGEKLFLFLNRGAKKAKKAHAEAILKKDGLYLGGQLIPPSHGRPFQPAMKIVQEKLGHKNNDGNTVSLSAMRKWHVVRGDTMKSLTELKDPELARTRGRIEISSLNFDDLEL